MTRGELELEPKNLGWMVAGLMTQVIATATGNWQLATGNLQLGSCNNISKLQGEATLNENQTKQAAQQQ